jgi:hypothetical protein
MSTILSEPNTTDPNLGSAPPPIEPKQRRPGPESKIGSLPKEQRALINRLLDDEMSYEEVVQAMAAEGVKLTVDNVSRWYKHGYQDHLNAREWQYEFQFLCESLAGMNQETDETNFHRGLIQFGLTKIFRAIKQDRFDDDPGSSIRAFNALARLSREALVLRKYVDQRADRAATQTANLDPNRELSKERELTLAAMERIFGYKASPGPIGPDMKDYMAKHAHLNKGTANEKYAAMTATPPTPAPPPTPETAVPPTPEPPPTDSTPPQPEPTEKHQPNTPAPSPESSIES